MNENTISCDSKIIKWIINHDDSKWFTFLYIGLAVVLSIWLSLFWLCVVVFVHFIMECIRQYYFDKFLPCVVIRAIWEVKLDIVLIFFALALAIYMDFIFGVAGINAASRTGANVASRSSRFARVGRFSRFLGRFANWQRMIRVFAVTADDGLRVVSMIASRKSKLKKTNKKENEEKTEEPFYLYGSWQAKWDKGDWFSIIFGLICLSGIIFSPYLTYFNGEEVLEIIFRELSPFA